MCQGSGPWHMFEAEGLTREGDAILKHLDFKAEG